MKSLLSRWIEYKKKRGIRNHPNRMLKVWREHGKETYDNPDIVTLKKKIVRYKRKLRRLFKPYNEKHCATCNGNCCYVIFGGYSLVEYAVMDFRARRLVNKHIVKTNKAIDKQARDHRCFYWKDGAGCKLDTDSQSILCVSFLCNIFKNALSEEDRKEAERITKKIRKYRIGLVDKVNEIRKGNGLKRLSDATDEASLELKLSN